jgi:hypothetical protein
MNYTVEDLKAIKADAEVALDLSLATRSMIARLVDDQLETVSRLRECIRIVAASANAAKRKAATESGIHRGYQQDLYEERLETIKDFVYIWKGRR